MNNQLKGLSLKSANMLLDGLNIMKGKGLITSKDDIETFHYLTYQLESIVEYLQEQYCYSCEKNFHDNLQVSNEIKTIKVCKECYNKIKEGKNND